LGASRKFKIKILSFAKPTSPPFSHGVTQKKFANTACPPIEGVQKEQEKS